MNEKISSFIWVGVCCAVSFVVFYLTKLFGKRGTDSDCERIKRDCGRAADNNRELADEERRTRIKLEEAERANQRAADVIRQQTEDYRRAAENNRRAKELINKAEEILSSDPD